MILRVRRIPRVPLRRRRRTGPSGINTVIGVHRGEKSLVRQVLTLVGICAEEAFIIFLYFFGGSADQWKRETSGGCTSTERIFARTRRRYPFSTTVFSMVTGCLKGFGSMTETFFV